MISHTYDFEARDVLQVVAPTLLPLVVFAAAMHLGVGLGGFPKPRPTLDVDRTILIHKADASRLRQDAEILLIGDSSCLIDVQARQLAEELGTPVLNLGTLSHLGLESHAKLLEEYFTANENRVGTVVVLMHPEALRLASPGRYHTDLLEYYLRGEDFVLTTTLRDRISHWLGFECFRGRIVARLMPVPLSGAYGRRYGFSSDLETSLVAHRGSAVDPNWSEFTGSPEYRLASQFEASSKVFRAAIPKGVELLVGVTPVPETFVYRDYAETRRAMLAQWRTWLQADSILTNLPATLPDRYFVKTTHLSEEGSRIYTSQLADCLRKRQPQ